MTRTVLSVAVAALFESVGVALANPTGPEVAVGTASFAAAGKTLTVTTTAGAIIDWRGFRIAPDEITRFVQPAVSSTVLNRIGSGEFGVLGRLESNGRVLFMQSGQVSGDGLVLDLPGINVAALRQPLPARATTRDVDFRTAGSAGRSVDAWVVLIAPETAGSGALLPPGVSAELADARWPHVRVRITAPPGQPLDVAQLLRRSGALGIFGSLLAVPRGRSAEGDGEPRRLAGTAPLAVALPAFQGALRDETPLPVLLAMGDDDIAAPAAGYAGAGPAASMQLAAGDDDIVVPAVASAQARPTAPVRLALALGDDDFAAPVIVMAQVRPSVPLAAGDDDIMAPAVALAAVVATGTAGPLMLAAAQTGTVHDAAFAEQPAASPAAQSGSIAAPALAEPAVAVAPVERPAPVIIASAETSTRRVALVASDTPVWPAPVKLERVERRMPVIMFDRKGGVFHL